MKFEQTGASPSAGRRKRRTLWWLAAGVLGWSVIAPQAIMAKARRDVAALNSGNYGPLLAGYAPGAVLQFHQGDHRWAGEHRGRPAIERFLQRFVAAGLQGEVREAWVSGPPWRATIALRFDDHAMGARGELIYSNRTILLLRTRWGRVVHHEDFYEDTERITRLEKCLRESEAPGASKT